MTKRLELSPDLSLPLDAATRRLAILAMSGAGKSNVAVVMAEQMFDAGIPWVAIDPKGDWWGIRSSKDGKGPGLPGPIFGGLHGDVPLDPSNGKLIAEMVVAQRLTCVLDVSEFEERQKQWGFLIDFGETLLRLNRQALHLFLEEADEYLPQRTSEKGNLPRCLGVWQRVVKRGRFRGIGSTQITQRNASINKDTLYMAEAIIAMRATGKADRAAVKGWVEHNQASDEIVTSLPTLGDGEAWVSSPAWLKFTKRVQFNRRRTFDSGATPVLLKGTVTPATLADIDLDALRTRMAATIEKAKADDPTELRKVIATKDRELGTLKKQLASAKPVVDETAIAAAVERARATWSRELERVVRGDLARFEKAVNGVKSLATMVQEHADAVASAFDALRGSLAPSADVPLPVDVTADVPRQRGAVAIAGVMSGVSRSIAPVTPKRAVVWDPHTTVAGRTDEALTAGAQKLRDAAAKFLSMGIDQPTRTQVAALAPMSPSSSATERYFAEAIRAGYFATPAPGVVQLTELGRAVAARIDTPTTLDDYVAEWRRLLGEGSERKLFDAMVERNAQPDRPIERAKLAEMADISPTSSATERGFAWLIGLDLLVVAGKGMVKAGPTMFPEGL